MRRERGQMAMKFRYRGRGGYRERAGRPKKPGAGVPHVPRPALAARHPVHVTTRVRDEAARLRSRDCFRVVASCIGKACERDGFRLVHFTVQSNHLHLIVESRNAMALARGIQGLCIDIAKAVNAFSDGEDRSLRIATMPTRCARRPRSPTPSRTCSATRTFTPLDGAVPSALMRSIR